MQVINYKFRIYPNREQEQKLNQFLGSARWLWNYFLAMNIEQYKETKKFIFSGEMQSKLPEMKKTEELEWLKEAPSQMAQQKLQDLDLALKNCFRHGRGFPKFKSKRTDCSGIRFPQGWNIKENKLSIPKVKGIKIKVHREILGKPTLLTVKKTRTGKWFVSICSKVENLLAAPKEIQNIVGIDVGIKHFAITSDGGVFDNQRFLKKKLKKLKHKQRSLSRKKKGSNNRNKARKTVALIHEKITNQRQDFIKKTANVIAKQNDLICIEDLNVSGMVKNRKLSQAISDVSWSMFFDCLKWQCLKHGSQLQVIDRFFASSKTCSNCGHKKEKLSLNERTYECESCEIVIDRDLNAAINIAKQGILIYNKNIKNTVGTTEINACRDMMNSNSSAQEAV